MFVEKRRLVQLVPERVQELWSTWELRVLVLISLALQISLIHFGSRRKYNVKWKIRIFLWFAYLLADWVATVALGVLSQSQGEDCSCDTNKKVSAGPPLDDELSCFWAPFLLLHLGGPDSITAYALEDNELWLRHLLGLLVQVSVASYIFILSWKNSLLPSLTIPMLLAGLIKYGERTLALRSAKQGTFRQSLLSPADPGPSYVKFMELVSLKRDEGYNVETEEIDDELPVPELGSCTDGDVLDFVADEVNMVVKAHELFRTFRRLFVDVILSFQERDSSQFFFQNLNPNIAPTTAFKIVETELGYAYDVFYTKAPVIHTRWGFIFRAVSFSTTCIVFLCFQWFLKLRHKNWIDLSITYVLLGGAIVIEIYAFVLVASSDWTTLWLSRHVKTPLPKVITLVQVGNKKRWSNSMAQINLLSYCLKRKPKKDWPLQDWFFRSVLQKFDENLDKILYLTREPISDTFKCSIFKHLLAKSKLLMSSTEASKLQDIVASRGNLALEEYAFPDFEVWTTKVEFDQSILLWHIATDLCYDHEPADEGNEDRKVSKHIADYMMYLLVMCPFMLPKGIGTMRFADTCEEAKEFFAGRNITSLDPKSKVCKMLLAINTEIKPAQVKGDRSKSVLFDACILASSLINQKEKKWEILRQVWIEMLAYAAGRCAGNYHAQQLRRGGELLTHVWLLMAHLGLTDQLQISKGHARVKLILS